MPEAPIRARVSMLIQAPRASVFDAFVEPDRLTEFWLASASAPLSVGTAVKWKFLVPGAEDQTIATTLDRPDHIAWRWSDDSMVDIALETMGSATAVTLIQSAFPGDREAQVEAALNAIEGFAIVLADLKTWLESGTSAGITRAKAKLIQARG